MDGQVLELQRQTQSSLELQRAKDGTYYWTIKIYFEGINFSDAINTLKTIDLCLRTDYLYTGAVAAKEA